MSVMANVYFWVCAVLAVIGALVTVLNPNPIRGAMGLLLMIVCVAGLFLALHAQFLAAIQLIVYAGAIVVLFLFVIMLLGPSAITPRDHRGRAARVVGGGLFSLCAIVAIVLLAKLAGGPAKWLASAPADFGGIDAFGRVLFSYGLVPFELSSALLMIAVVGAVAVARGKQDAGTKFKHGGPLEPRTVDATIGNLPMAREHHPGTLDANNPPSHVPGQVTGRGGH